MEMRGRAHGVKQRQTAPESGDYLSFNLPYRLNQPAAVHPSPSASRSGACTRHTHPHTYTAIRKPTHTMVTKWQGVTLL